MSNPLASYLAVIRAANENLHFEDFKIAGRLSKEINSGYQARMTAFLELTREGFIILESGRLSLGVLSDADWLTSALMNGEAESWEICDLYQGGMRKFDPDQFNLQLIGREGEDFVISFLLQHLPVSSHSTIEHISLLDDSAGYDISFIPPGEFERVFLEVKTSTRVSRHFPFHLSRNEWNVASRTANWHLLLVQKSAGAHVLYGHLDSKSLVAYFPQDRHDNFEWTSARGFLSMDDIFVGFPGIRFT